MFSICFKRTSSNKLTLSRSSSATLKCLTILNPQRLVKLLLRRYWRLIPDHLKLLLLLISISISLVGAYTYWTTNQFTFPANPRIIYTAAHLHSVQTMSIAPPTFRDPCGNSSTSSSPLMVTVISSPHHFAQRASIRDTWGKRAAELGISLYYLIGKTDDLSIQEQIYQEHFTHNDLLQANFADTYFNLTLKSLAMMNWIGRTLERGQCSSVRYALKVDDDMFVNIEAIEGLVKDQNDGIEKFIGRLHSGDQPIRKRFNKYYLSEASFSGATFPDFVTGAAYLFTVRSAAAIYRAATLEPEGAIFLEDVYVTGILPQRLGNRIRREDHPRFVNWEVDVSSREDFNSIWTSHNVSPKEMRRRWAVVNGKHHQSCKLFWWSCS